MIKKLKYKKGILLLFLLVILIFSINNIVSSVIRNKVSELLVKNNSELYSASIKNIEFKLLARSVDLEDVFLSPSSKFISEIKDGKSQKNNSKKISASSINLTGISLFKLIFQTSIEVNHLNINNLLIQSFENSKLPKKSTQIEKSINMDSIYIEELNGFQINNINFKNIKYQVIDLSTNKVTFQNNPISFESSGFKLEEYNENLFKLKPVNNSIEINDIDLTFENTHFEFSIDKIKVQFEERLVSIKNLDFKPIIEPAKLANTYKFNNDVIGIHIDKLDLLNYDLFKTLNQEGVFIDSIWIDGLSLDIYKDKRKPFDTNKRPKLPHIALKKLKLPLHIQKIKINNGNLKLKHKLNKRDLSMELSIDDIDAQITNITSIKALRENPLKVNIDGKFMKNANLKVIMDFPLRDHQNTFYFGGSLGAAKLYMFDTAIFPILGLKVLKGDLDKLIFSASANEISSSGKMTMLYHDLEAEVFKANSIEENNFLSWTVNNVVRESNPGKNKKIRKVAIGYTRTEYKGLGNYIWKTIQNGIVNTMAPFGIKTEKDKSKKKKRNDKAKT